MKNTVIAILAAIGAPLSIPAVSAQTAPPPASPAPAAPPVASPAPDYTQDAAWLCRPGRTDACSTNQDVTIIQANGKRKVEKFKPAPAPQFDCFYVYPTVSNDPTPNSDMNAGPEEAMVAASQAARFASKCRVFAPLYRQVTLTALKAFITGQPVTMDRDMPLADVTAAWNDYLERDNKGRGVVLIGHSQGSGVLKALVAASIEAQPIRRNIISVMLLGTNVAVPAGKDVGGDFKQMPLCHSDSQFGCVVSYVTFRADSPPPANSRFGKVPDAGMVAACTNPAALAGGKAETDAIFGAKGAGTGSEPMGPWTTDNAPVTTNFVKVPSLISAECVSKDGFNYLAATVNADPKDPRTDTIVGDVVVGGVTLKDWGLHLLDMPIAMGNLVDLADHQAAAWRGVPYKK
ncbi:MAG: DUF3089 domain-containing protein [Sphingomonas sp.]